MRPDIALSPSFAYRMIADPALMRAHLRNKPLRIPDFLSSQASAREWYFRVIRTQPTIDRQLRECIENNLRFLRTAVGRYRKSLRRLVTRQLAHLQEFYYAEALSILAP